MGSATKHVPGEGRRVKGAVFLRDQGRNRASSESAGAYRLNPILVMEPLKEVAEQVVERLLAQANHGGLKLGSGLVLVHSCTRLQLREKQEPQVVNKKVRDKITAHNNVRSVASLAYAPLPWYRTLQPS